MIRQEYELVVRAVSRVICLFRTVVQIHRQVSILVTEANLCKSTSN